MVKFSDTLPFLIKSPSEALEGSISMVVLGNKCVYTFEKVMNNLPFRSSEWII